ncbi:hypothetical protein ACFV5G_29625 [Streptomyces sp. NPDC059766]|uniref:hypothetical protein n=1 Tax=Streptomyces sp. NPDC059766 TaxID=3346940 RepID=UPI0036687C98
MSGHSGAAVVFDPAEVATFLTWLTTALSDPKAICAVSAAYADCDPMGWAWSLRDGVALDAEAAATVFGENVELRGAETRYITLTKVMGRTDVSGISLTDDVKAVINNHGGAPLDASNGHTIALRATGTITVHFNAADEDAAREALGEIEYEDFDVEFRTGGGHLIGHVTIDDADGTELVSVDGTPADELDG